jgi:hypothetical protein
MALYFICSEVSSSTFCIHRCRALEDENSYAGDDFVVTNPYKTSVGKSERKRSLRRPRRRWEDIRVDLRRIVW